MIACRAAAENLKRNGKVMYLLIDIEKYFWKVVVLNL